MRTRSWGTNWTEWSPYLREGFSGVVLNSYLDGEVTDLLLQELSPHLPKVDQITVQATLFFPGAGINIHEDKPGHEFGATVYLNEEWESKDGGIFMWETKKGSGEWRGLVPEENTVIIVDDDTPHQVTPVSPHIQCPRMTLQIWGDNGTFPEKRIFEP